MGYTTSTVHGIEVPDSAEANNVPEDIGKVVTALEAGSLVKRLTGAAIAALTSPQKPAGLLVYNTTTGVLQISDGTNFKDVPAITATGVWTDYTPTLTSSGTNPTHAPVSSESRYMQIGKTVIGRGMTNVSVVGTGTYRIALPVTPKSTAANARRVGFMQISAGNYVQHFSLEQVNGQTYCQGIAVESSAAIADVLTAPVATSILTLGGGSVTVSWDFTYEAA